MEHSVMKVRKIRYRLVIYGWLLLLLYFLELNTRANIIITLHLNLMASVTAEAAYPMTAAFLYFRAEG